MTKGNGFTTPDVKEAMVKKKSMQKTKERYVLCDSSKFRRDLFDKFCGIQVCKDNYNED